MSAKNKTHCKRGHLMSESRTFEGNRGSSRCRICRDNYRREWENRKSVVDPDWLKKFQIKRDYNLSFEKYSALLNSQEGKCAICNENILDKPYIDHDHKTDQVRGLLCDLCNKGLGFFKDNTENLDNAIKYLKKSRI